MIEGKQKRAVELHEKGLSTAAIAERIGSTPRATASMICRARLKAEREEAKAVDELAGAR